MSSNKDLVELIINDVSVDNIVSYEIHYDLFQGTSHFTAEIDHSYFFDITGEPLFFSIWVNGVKMMNGWIDKIDKSYSKNHLTQHVTGRDYMQLLTDNYVLFPNFFPSKKIKDNDFFEVYTKHDEKISIREIIITQLGLTEVDGLDTDTWVSNIHIDKIQKNLGDAEETPVAVDEDGNYSADDTLPPSPLKIDQFFITFHANTQEVIEGNRLKNFRTNHGQTLFEYIGHLVSMLGCHMYNIPGTDEILILKLANNPDDDNELCSFDMNGDPFVGEQDSHYDFFNEYQGAFNNVINCDFSTDISNFYKYVKILGQAQTDSDPSLTPFFAPPPPPGATNQSIEPLLKLERIERAGYSGLTKFFTQELNSVDSMVWKSESISLVNNFLLQQYRKLFNLKYTVSGHTPDNSNNPYFFNRMAFVNDGILGIKGGQFIIYGVTYKGSKTDGRTTLLELCLPNINTFLIKKMYQSLTLRSYSPQSIEGVPQ